jgi:hypothetical protein
MDCWDMRYGLLGYEVWIAGRGVDPYGAYSFLFLVMRCLLLLWMLPKQPTGSKRN